MSVATFDYYWKNKYGRKKTDYSLFKSKITAYIILLCISNKVCAIYTEILQILKLIFCSNHENGIDIQNKNKLVDKYIKTY